MTERSAIASRITVLLIELSKARVQRDAVRYNAICLEIEPLELALLNLTQRERRASFMEAA